MPNTTSPAVNAARPVWFVILAAGAIVGMAMGLRSVMALYLKPISTDLGIGREPFSNAMAIANLAWGVFAILTGAFSDKFGAGRVVVVCALSTAIGLLAMMSATSPSWMYLSGLLTGLGVAGTGASGLVGAVGRAVRRE